MTRRGWWNCTKHVVACGVLRHCAPNVHTNERTTMNTIRLGLYVLAIAIIAALAVTLARAGSTPTAQHEVVLLASSQDWANPPYVATIYSCTRSSGAPPCPIGANSAQAVADLLNAGYHVEPALAPTIEFGVALVK